MERDGGTPALKQTFPRCTPYNRWRARRVFSLCGCMAYFSPVLLMAALFHAAVRVSRHAQSEWTSQHPMFALASTPEAEWTGRWFLTCFIRVRSVCFTFCLCGPVTVLCSHLKWHIVQRSCSTGPPLARPVGGVCICGRRALGEQIQNAFPTPPFPPSGCDVKRARQGSVKRYFTCDVDGC
ncbi:hypothetical protein BV25DRAFT_1545108 [Artomyces pyxidatus]|uniref:Uncharacterized protein n=1 Tax=Artomyces pyxidatus TaxID=48021 RepID=A0ACB8SL98_9AGAM|nr:hypothetical protein BV25DRAFT_1545108 [Artomyces pyxidatus]